MNAIEKIVIGNKIVVSRQIKAKEDLERVQKEYNEWKSKVRKEN